MKTATAFAAALAAGLALAPMAADSASITFEASDPISSEGSELSGLMFVGGIIGQNTPRNAGESIACNGCGLEFSTGPLLSGGFTEYFPDDQSYESMTSWQGTGGGSLEIFRFDDTSQMYTTLLRGIFAEPVTATLSTFRIPSDAYGDLFVKGVLRDVVIDEDLAAYYGVPNWGTSEVEMRGSGRYTQGGPGIHDLDTRATVTFSPVPVPAALPLMLTALAGLGLIRLRRTQAA